MDCREAITDVGLLDWETIMLKTHRGTKT
jgi:hypothetical protein